MQAAFRRSRCAGRAGIDVWPLVAAGRSSIPAGRDGDRDRRNPTGRRSCARPPPARRRDHRRSSRRSAGARRWIDGPSGGWLRRAAPRRLPRRAGRERSTRALMAAVARRPRLAPLPLPSRRSLRACAHPARDPMRRHDPRPRRPQTHRASRIHRATLHPQDLTRRHGIPVTSPARTLLDLAATEPPTEVDRALNEARIARLVSDPSLNEQFSRYPRHRGTAALTRRAARRRRLHPLQSGAAARSPWSASPACRSQRPTCASPATRSTPLWREQRLIVEFDGYATHGTRRSFEEDRRRDQQLVAKGWRVVRITWRQLNDEPIAVVARLATALAA